MNSRITLTLGLALAYCVPAAAVFDDRTTDSKYAPADVIDRPLHHIDLPRLIDPSLPTSVGGTDENFVIALDQALTAFGASGGDAKIARNKIQDRLILSSNDLCENYKSRLKQKQSRFNFFAGTAATLFGAAGSLLPHAATAKLLSGLSASATGIRAEYNHDYYADVTAHVITKAITLRRKTMLTDIDKLRDGDITAYTLERALADAVNYHGACSLVGGLEEAEKAVSTMETLRGTDNLEKVFLNLQKLRTSLAAPPAATSP